MADSDKLSDFDAVSGTAMTLRYSERTIKMGGSIYMWEIIDGHDVVGDLLVGLVGPNTLGLHMRNQNKELYTIVKRELPLEAIQETFTQMGRALFGQPIERTGNEQA